MKKKLFKKPILKTKVGKLVLGAADTFTGGLVSNLAESTEEHPAGKLDKYKAIGVLVVGLVLAYLVLTGKITITEAQDIKELVE